MTTRQSRSIRLSEANTVSTRENHGRTHLRKSAIKRLADARALLRTGDEHTGGAMYLAGYAVECKLKAVALEIFGCWTLEALAEKWDVDERDVYTHGLEALAKRLPLYGRLAASPVWRDFAGAVNQWKPSWRYSPKNPRREKAESFLESVSKVCTWLDSNRC